MFRPTGTCWTATTRQGSRAVRAWWQRAWTPSPVNPKANTTGRSGSSSASASWCRGFALGAGQVAAQLPPPQETDGPTLSQHSWQYKAPSGVPCTRPWSDAAHSVQRESAEMPAPAAQKRPPAAMTAWASLGSMGTTGHGTSKGSPVQALAACEGQAMTLAVTICWHRCQVEGGGSVRSPSERRTPVCGG